MYRTTAGTFDALTLNAPYPRCHSNRRPCSRIHFDEFALMVPTAFASEIVGGISISK